MKIQCPTCKNETQWEDNVFRPFCSERCKLLDLGAWAMEKHAIPDDHQPDDEKPNPTPRKNEEEEE